MSPADRRLLGEAAVDVGPCLSLAVQAVTLGGWINEWDIVNKDESVPEKRFRLYALIRESPRLICAEAR